MNWAIKHTIKILLFLGLIFLTSCAPKVTFYVTIPPKLPIESIESIILGDVNDAEGQAIQMPVGVKPKNRKTFSPSITGFHANKKAADLIRASLAAGLSASNQYKILQTHSDEIEISGVLPDATKTGVITAEVKYFEKTFDSSETYFFTLIATKQGNTLQEQLALLAAKQMALTIPQNTKKGFHVEVPYIETVSAMEVKFDLINQASAQPIIPTQVFRSYYVRKWGGKSNQSHVPPSLKAIIVNQYQKDEQVIAQINTELENLQQAIQDPDEFLAKGGKLKRNRSVPRNALDIKTRLANSIIKRFLQQISQYTIVTTLNIASGDKLAVTYIKANAYDLAINRLENIQRDEADSFNLGLAYESVGEYKQAKIYYQEALDKNPGNQVYQQSISRVHR